MKTEQYWLMAKLPHTDLVQEAILCPECGAALEQVMTATEHNGVREQYFVCRNEDCKNKPYFGIIFTDDMDPETAA